MSSYLYKIADALQIPLDTCCGQDAISGVAHFNMPMGNCSLEFDAEIFASFVNKKQRGAGVLMRIKGDLFILVVYSSTSDLVLLFLVDAGIWKSLHGKATMSLKRTDTLAALNERFKSSFVKQFKFKRNSWVSF